MSSFRSNQEVKSIDTGSYPKDPVPSGRSLGGFLQDARKLFAAALRRLLDREGFSRSGLATYLGVSQTMVSRWQAGGILPTKHLEGIADYLKVSISELFAVDGAKAADGGRPITQEEALRALARSLGYTVRRIRTDEA